MMVLTSSTGGDKYLKTARRYEKNEQFYVFRKLIDTFKLTTSCFD